MTDETSTPPGITRVPVRQGRGRSKVDWRTYDPSAIDADGDDLVAELLTYKRNLGRLLERRGDYVLIKGDQVVGVYATLADALDAGAARFGEEPALIKQIVLTEPALPSGGLAL